MSKLKDMEGVINILTVAVVAAVAVMALFFTETFFGTPLMKVMFATAAVLLGTSVYLWIAEDRDEEENRRHIYIYRDAKGLHLVPETAEGDLYGDVEIIFPERVCVRKEANMIRITGSAFTMTNGVRGRTQERLQVSIPRGFKNEDRALEAMASMYPKV